GLSIISISSGIRNLTAALACCYSGSGRTVYPAPAQRTLVSFLVFSTAEQTPPAVNAESRSQKKEPFMRVVLPLLVLVVIAVAATAKPTKQTAKDPNWSVSGWEVTTCCCNDICPCRYNEKPTHMECESIIAV